jgi:formiminotetrahydrofolate cyclodeaminase
MYDASQTISNFLDGAAAKQPAPGGGSVTALVGALAASMGEMVLNYSVGKKSLAAHDAELRGGLAEFHRARQILVELMVEDQQAYEAVTALRKLPEDSPERRQQYGPTLLACIRIPEAMAATGVAILNLCDGLADKVNHYLLSDLAVCAELAMATVRCGVHNVRVNLGDLHDAKEREDFELRAASHWAHAVERVREVIPRIWDRVRASGQPTP